MFNVYKLIPSIATCSRTLFGRLEQFLPPTVDVTGHRRLWSVGWGGGGGGGGGRRHCPHNIDSPLKPQIPKTQITECICGYRNGTTLH